MDPDPGGQKTRGSGGFGSATVVNRDRTRDGVLPMEVLRRESMCCGWSVMVNFMAVTTVVRIRADGEPKLI
jgi:hypothetical protein